MGHLTISMRQKVENEILRLNAYLYDVALLFAYCLVHVHAKWENLRNAYVIFVWLLTPVYTWHKTFFFKEFTWTTAKSCDKFLIQNLDLFCWVQQHCQQHFLTR